LSGAIAPISRTAACFLMCHGSLSPSEWSKLVIGGQIGPPNDSKELARFYGVNSQSRIQLPVTRLLSIAFPPLTLEYNDLLGLALLHDVTCDGRIL
jgi:hypothetical protein